MATTEAQKKATQKWIKENTEDIRFRVPKGKKEIIRNYAERHGESVNAFINRAVDEALERDAKESD